MRGKDNKQEEVTEVKSNLVDEVTIKRGKARKESKWKGQKPKKDSSRSVQLSMYRDRVLEMCMETFIDTYRDKIGDRYAKNSTLMNVLIEQFVFNETFKQESGMTFDNIVKGRSEFDQFIRDIWSNPVFKDIWFSEETYLSKFEHKDYPLPDTSGQKIVCNVTPEMSEQLKKILDEKNISLNKFGGAFMKYILIQDKKSIFDTLELDSEGMEEFDIDTFVHNSITMRGKIEEQLKKKLQG